MSAQEAGANSRRRNFLLPCSRCYLRLVRLFPRISSSIATSFQLTTTPSLPRVPSTHRYLDPELGWELCPSDHSPVMPPDSPRGPTIHVFASRSGLSDLTAWTPASECLGAPRSQFVMRPSLRGP